MATPNTKRRRAAPEAVAEDGEAVAVGGEAAEDAAVATEDGETGSDVE